MSYQYNNHHVLSDNYIIIRVRKSFFFLILDSCNENFWWLNFMGNNYYSLYFIVTSYQFLKWHATNDIRFSDQMYISNINVLSPHLQRKSICKQCIQQKSTL